MRRLVIASLLLCARPAPAMAQDDPMPPGDYRDSCTSIVWSQNVLHATCKKKFAQTYTVENHLNYQPCKWQGYEFVMTTSDGKLQCVGRAR